MTIISCEEDVIFIENFEYAENIMGKWKQTRSFDLVDDTIIPNAWDWFDVENGFTLEILEDNRFVYNNYANCISGTYSFDVTSLNIEFQFDCEIEFWGENIDILIESFWSDLSQNYLIMVHADATFTDKQAISTLQRIH